MSIKINPHTNPWPPGVAYAHSKRGGLSIRSDQMGDCEGRGVGRCRCCGHADRWHAVQFVYIDGVCEGSRELAVKRAWCGFECAFPTQRCDTAGSITRANLPVGRGEGQRLSWHCRSTLQRKIPREMAA